MRNLRTYFYTWAGVVKAVDDVNLEVKEGETLGLVGESGSGKTVTALSILRIVPSPGRIIGGEILYKGENLLEKSEDEMQRIRGKEIAYIFQDPQTSLDPVYSIAEQLVEVIQRLQKIDKKAAVEKAIGLLKTVEIPDPDIRIWEYPHQMSGGMKQRVAVARALSCEPSLLLADEPTTSLDVTIQAQILELMKSLKKKLRMSMILITHDMGVVAETTDRVTVLYAGQVCESCDTRTIFHHPKHPYTEALLTAVPYLSVKREKLEIIPGNIPNLVDPPSGCRFHPRCRYAKPICKKRIPQLEEIEPGHLSACLRVREIDLRSPLED